MGGRVPSKLRLLILVLALGRDGLLFFLALLQTALRVFQLTGVFDMSSSSFDNIVERCWESLPLPEQVTLPWERNHWNSVFGEAVQSVTEPVVNFRRPILLYPGMARDETVEREKKFPKIRMRDSSLRWKDFIRPGEEVLWQAKREADMQTAIKRWYDIVQSFPETIGIKILLGQQNSTALKLKMVRNLLWNKAPATLVKRANSISRYVEYLRERSLMFPGDEGIFYEFLVSQQAKEVKASRLQGVIESLRFVRFVMDVPELAALTDSRRCNGAASVQPQIALRQADIFSVREILCLHFWVLDDYADDWDRVMAGTVLCCIYSRSRWSDLMHTESCYEDWDSNNKLKYLEFRIGQHKCSKSACFKHIFLYAVVPVEGVGEDPRWVMEWLACRERMGLKFSKDQPFMPAPSTSALPSKRPITSSEMQIWTRTLLTHHDIDISGKRLTSHSCKRTTLAWCSMYGLDWQDRLVLGGHSMGLRSVMTYSRDVVARPIMLLEKVMESIRNGTFRPDETRSGRFVSNEPDQGTNAGGTLQKPLSTGLGSSEYCPTTPEVEAVANSTLIEISDDEDNSSKVKTEVEDERDAISDIGLTSSSSDSEAGRECPSKRLVRLPCAPENHRLVQHTKLKTVHLQETGHHLVLVCGRNRNQNYVDSELMVRWDTPCCHICWKKFPRG